MTIEDALALAEDVASPDFLERYAEMKHRLVWLETFYLWLLQWYVFLPETEDT